MSTSDLQFKGILDDIEKVRKVLAEETMKAGKWLRDQGNARVLGLAPPPPIDLFCGRIKELSNLADYFSTSCGIRIAAIIGGSGLGKTALARKFLRDVNVGDKLPYVENCIEPEGILYLSTRTTGISFERIFFDCARLIQEENDLRSVWDSKMGVREKAKRLICKPEMQESMYLILLDNFEELIDSQGKIKDNDLQEFFYALYEMKSQAAVLITSNEPLSLPREFKEFYFPIPLDKGLSLTESKELLLQLDVDNKMGLRDLPDAALAGILEKVKGVPRVLELLASLLNHKQRMRAEDMLSLIPEGSSEEVIKGLSKETYLSLNDREKRVLEALAVFFRPVPVVAVEFMLFPFLPDSNVSEVAKGLGVTHTISYEILTQKMDSIWLSLHPIDQKSVYRQISTDESKAYNLKALEKRAADYYAKLRLERPWFRIAQLDPQLLEFAHRLRGEDHKTALQVIDRVDYSMENHHKYLASLMALGLGNRAIEMRTQLKGKLGDRNLEAQNLTSMGWVCRRMGRKEEAKAYLTEAVNLHPPDPKIFIYCLSELGYFLTDNANLHDEAEKHLLQALDLAKQIGDEYLEAHCLLGLAFVDFQRGDNVSSLKFATNARNLFQSIESPYRELDCVVRLGMIFRKEMKYEAAIKTAVQGLAVAKKANLENWEGELNSGLGFHYRGLGKYSLAIDAHKEALRLFTSLAGMKREEAVQQSYLGNLFLDLGQFEEAKKAYDEAERIAENVGLSRELNWIWGTKGILLKKKGNYREALDLQKKGLDKVCNVHPDSSIIRYTDLADTLLAMGQYEQAQSDINQALVISAKSLKKPLSLDVSFAEAYLQAPIQEDALPHEMQSPGDYQRRGVILALSYLHLGDLENARIVIEKARKNDAIPHRHATAALHGLVSLRLGRTKEAKSLFLDALKYAEESIERERNYYDAYYAKGLALTGLGLLATDDQSNLLNKAAETYELARDICSEKGVIDDALQLLDEIRFSGTKQEASLVAPIRKVLVRTR